MSETKKKSTPYIWWATVLSSAALLGFFIGGVVPWWAFLIPWVFYATMVLTFLVLVFAIGFIGVVIAVIEDENEKRNRERK